MIADGGGSRLMERKRGLMGESEQPQLSFGWTNHNRKDLLFHACILARTQNCDTNCCDAISCGKASPRVTIPSTTVNRTERILKTRL
ncbi:hypothetical protein EVAR_74953_1 [Eumeta japonica]|uniref:Uncharacterized protein n=1 Tax=Eumeta variegata TaxID=151549 RepID=A0A4C1UI95_EUMVA|nr:hypothetical protein EVAR_74953_1 [Eumeta japonica]